MANGSKDSDDDFESTSPLLSQNLIRRNQKIPAGHLLAALKWRTTNVVEKIKESIKVLFNPNLGVVDFHPSAECAVMFISPAEMVEGNLYRKRLAGLRAVKGIRKVVVAERTPTSLQHFSNLQQFAVLELELDLIPITENTLHLLLIQMVSTENKLDKNPFTQPVARNPDEQNEHIVAALKNVPKIGDKKILQLLEKFGSLQNVATASLNELTSLLGPSLASSVWDYFNK